MRVHKKTVRMIYVSMALFATAIFLPCPASASVDSELIDFGDVIVGSSKTMVLNITNLDSEYNVTLDFILMQSSCNFSIDAQGIEVQPGQTVGVEVLYSPLDVGVCSVNLSIFYSIGAFENVTLRGTGVEVEVEEEEEEEVQEQKEIEGLLEFFDGLVEDKKLKGYGPGKSAHRRLNALRKMIKKVDNLIEKKDFKRAYRRLMAVYKKVDGLNPPKGSSDFVVDDTSSLRSRIEEMLETLVANGAGKEKKLRKRMGKKARPPQDLAKF